MAAEPFTTRPGWFALLASSGTLLCCVLPIVLVTLGFGGALASLLEALPWLAPLSQHKHWVFGLAALAIALGFWFSYRPGRQCPADPKLAAACATAQRFNRRLLWLSLALWVLGFFTAYLLLPLRMALDL